MVRSQFEPYWHSFKILGTQFRKNIQLFLAWFKQVSINQSNFTLTLFCCKFLENVFSQILSGPNCFVFVAIMRNVLRLSFVEHGQTRTSQRPWWGRHCNRIYPPNLNSADPWWFLQHLRQFPRGLRVFVEKLGAVRVSIYISLSSKTQKTFKNQKSHNRDESMTGSPSYFGQILDMVRLKKPSSKVLPSCSPYAILVVSTTLMVFLAMVFVAKKLIEHVKDEDSFVRTMMMHKSKSRCPCQENHN